MPSPEFNNRGVAVREANAIRLARKFRTRRKLILLATRGNESCLDGALPSCVTNEPARFRRARKYPYVSTSQDFNPQGVLAKQLAPLKEELIVQEFGSVATEKDIEAEKIFQLRRWMQRDREGKLTGAMRRFGREHRMQIWELVDRDQASGK